MRVLLLTGPGGDAQGWGDMSVTQSVADAATAVGHPARIAFVETEQEFLRVIGEGRFDIVWSALYYITPNEKFIGRGEGGMWVADVLDSKGIPYIGSNSQTMKDMIDKFKTHETLASRGVAVPAHHLVRTTDEVSMIRYPAFVKPMGESRSVGINDDSVVNSADESGARWRGLSASSSRPRWSKTSCPVMSSPRSSSETGRRANACPASCPSSRSTTAGTRSSGRTCAVSA